MSKKRFVFVLGFLLIMVLVTAYFDLGSVQKIGSDSDIISTGIEEERDLPRSQQIPVKTHLNTGKRFSSLDELITTQRSAGYLKIGMFGNHWPGMVREVADGQGTISFVRQDGTRHKYNGFDGYRLKMVRLDAAGEETIVVFRSVEKN